MNLHVHSLPVFPVVPRISVCEGYLQPFPVIYLGGSGLDLCHLPLLPEACIGRFPGQPFCRPTPTDPASGYVVTIPVDGRFPAWSRGMQTMLPTAGCADAPVTDRAVVLAYWGRTLRGT